MPPGWDDPEALGRALHERFPRRDPLAVRPPDLERWAAELPGFDPAAGRPDPGRLEAVQRAWHRAFAAAPAPADAPPGPDARALAPPGGRG